MELWLLIFSLFLMGIIQIAIFKSFPHIIQKLFCCSIFLAMVVNFLLSSVILLFTGTSFIAGASNLGGSIIFGIYLTYYKARRQIQPMKLKWKMGMIPYVVINEENPSEHWLF